MTTNAEREHMGRVAELGCSVCRRMGQEGTPAQVHHPRRLAGGWGRSSNMTTIPLCWEHHHGKTGVHGLGTKGFPKHWGFEETDLLKDTLDLLNLPSD